MPPILIALAAASPAADEASIRQQRARSNAAIAAHRFEDMRPTLHPAYTVLPGSIGRPSNLEQTAERLLATFAEPGFVAYVRTPVRIQVAGSRKRAAETGTWVGTWNKPEGIKRLSGIYQATWIPTESGWQLLNEAFVTLD